MNTLFELSQELIALWDVATTNFVDITRRFALVQPDGRTLGEVYQQTLRRLFLWVIIFPLPVALFGIFTGWGWVVALVGMLWGLCSLAVFAAAAPLGLLIELVSGGQKDSGQRYVSIIKAVLTGELLFILFLSVMPIGNNLGVLPIIIIAALLLTMISSTKSDKPKKWLARFAVLIMLFLIVSLFLPDLPRVLSTKVGKINEAIAEMEPKNSMIPIGGAIDTQEQMDAYNKKVDALKGTTVAPVVVEGKSSLPQETKKDLISFPTSLTKKDVWSKEVNLFSLNPFRNNYDFSVSDSVVVEFRDGTKFIIGPGDKLKAGKRPAIVRYMAIRDNTEVVASAWN